MMRVDVEVLSCATHRVDELLFGWGRMQGPALAQVAEWGRVAAMGLPPQAVVAVALTVLASQGRMRPAAALYGAALLALLGLAATEPRDGAALMAVLNAVFMFVALGLLISLGTGAARCLPVRAMVWPLGALLVVAALLRATGGAEGLPMVATLALAVHAGLAVLAAAWHGAGAMRLALRR